MRTDTPYLVVAAAIAASLALLLLASPDVAAQSADVEMVASRNVITTLESFELTVRVRLTGGRGEISRPKITENGFRASYRGISRSFFGNRGTVEFKYVIQPIRTGTLSLW